MTNTTQTQRSGRSIYQRSVPVFVVSFIAAVLIAYYFISWQPLQTFYQAATSWGVIVSLMILLFGSVVLLLWQGRTFVARRSTKDVFNSGVFLGAMVFFTILGFMSNSSVNNEPFLGVYSGSIGNIYIFLWMVASIFVNWETIQVMSYIRSLEGLVFLIGFLPSVFFQVTSLVALWYPFFTIGNWIIMVPNVAVTKVAAAVAAIGGIVLGIRALWGKEPGLIEMEMK